VLAKAIKVVFTTSYIQDSSLPHLAAVHSVFSMEQGCVLPTTTQMNVEHYSVQYHPHGSTHMSVV